MDQGIFIKGFQAQPTEKTPFDNVFFYYFLFDFSPPQLIFSYTEFFLRKTIILNGSSSDRGSSWGPTFSKGGDVQLFSRGSGGQR